MRAALVRDGRVDNVILAGEDYEPENGYTAVKLDDESPVGPGWAYDGNAFSAPAAETPSEPEAPVEYITREEFDMLLTMVLEG